MAFWIAIGLIISLAVSLLFCSIAHFSKNDRIRKLEEELKKERATITMLPVEIIHRTYTRKRDD